MGKIYGGFRSEPVKKGAPKGNMKKHCTATKEYAEDQREKQMRAYGYSEIEPENVKYNRVLVDCPETYDEKIKECQTEKFGGKTIRRDGVPMIDTVFYYSPEKTKNLLCYLHRKNTHWKQEHAEWWAEYQAIPKEERHEKINAEYNWVQSWAKASEKWAEENLGQVVHCVLHCHEGTPHLDCKTLAIKEKEGGKWIWAKREILGNPAHLSKMQSKYADECGKKFGLERGEIKETGELRKHAETERHMAAKAREQEEAHLEQLQKSVGELRKRKTASMNAVGALDNQLEDKGKQLEEMNAEIAEKKKEVSELDAAQTRFKTSLSEWVDAHNGLQRVLRAAPRLSSVNRDKIETRMEQAVSQCDAVLSEELDDVDSILKAAAELERGKRVFALGKQAVKNNLNIDELLKDDDFERC